MVETLIASKEVKAVAMEIFSELVVNEIEIADYAKELVQYTIYDDAYLKVLENLLALDTEGNFRISIDLVNDKISEMLDFLSNDTDDMVESCAVRLASVPPLQSIMTDKLSSKSIDYLIKLPSELKAMMVEKFAEHLGDFEANIGVLELIASHGTKSNVKELVKVITKKMMTNGQESIAVFLIKKLHYCNKKNFELLVSSLKNCSDDSISEEDKNVCFEHLSKIVPTK